MKIRSSQTRNNEHCNMQGSAPYDNCLRLPNIITKSSTSDVAGFKLWDELKSIHLINWTSYDDTESD